MLLRRKLYVAVLFAAILFLMIASQTIHRNHFQSAVMPTGQNLPTRGGSSERNGETGSISAASSSSDSPKTTPAPPHIQPQGQDPGAGAEPVGDPQAGEEILGKSKTQSKPSGKLCDCTDGCISDLSTPGSDWFRQRYDPHQQPVLHQGDHNMEPSALSWWLGLQRSNDGQTLEEVMSKMFQVISPPTLQLSPLPSRCRSCAVVGNSGNLQGSTHGKLIDSHTSIIRMNKAVTVGFEQDVGNRTTYHFLYPESAVDVGVGVSLVLLPFKLRDLEWLTSALSTGQITMTYMRVKDRVQADRDKVLVVNPVFFKYAHDHWTEHHGRYPSTGMLALVFALHTCDKVSVFGYGADQDGNWHHYWEENRYAGAFRKTGVHSADFEMQVIHHLAKEGKISLYL